MLKCKIKQTWPNKCQQLSLTSFLLYTLTINTFWKVTNRNLSTPNTCPKNSFSSFLFSSKSWNVQTLFYKHSTNNFILFTAVGVYIYTKTQTGLQILCKQELPGGKTCFYRNLLQNLRISFLFLTSIIF